LTRVAGPGERACRAGQGLLAVVALVLAAGLYFQPLLPFSRPTHYIASDFASYFYPVFRYVAEEVAAGRLPHWTPYVGVGYPLLSDIEACVFYPPIRLMTFLTAPPSYLALELYAIGHYVIAGAGMLVLGGRFGLPLVAAGVAALTFMLSGFGWAHSAHLTIIQSSAWLPWLLVAYHRALATSSAGWTVAGGGVFALVLLGGHPQIALYVAVALALSGALAAWERRGRGSARVTLGPVARTAGIVVLGLALAAPQLVPTATLAPATPRWTPGLRFLLSDTLTLDQLVTFLIPQAYYGTDRYRSVDELYAYVGIGALLLGSAALVLRRDLWTRYLALLVGLGLGLALAPLLPVFATLLPSVPVLGLFRASARALLLTDFGAAALSGMGLHAWERAVAAGEGHRLRRLVWAWRGVVGLALAGWAVVLLGRVPAWAGPLSGRFPEYYAAFVLVLVGHVVVLELWRAGWLRPSLGLVATALLVVANLTVPHRGLAWALSSPELAWQHTEVAAQIRAEPGRQRIWNEGWLQRRGRAFEANAGLSHRLEIVSHYTSLHTTRYDDFLRNVGDFGRDATLVDLLNTRYLVFFEGDTRPEARGHYPPPRIEAGSERRYDVRRFLDQPIGQVLASVEPDPTIPWARPPTLVVRGNDPLEVCLGCGSAAGPGEGPGGTTAPEHLMLTSAALPQPQPAGRLRLRNELPHAVTVRELRLDAVDLFGLGPRYHRLGANVWENVDVLPRAFLVEEVLVLPETALVMPALLASDPRRTAIVEKPPACRHAVQLEGTPPPDQALEIVEYGPHRVRVRTRHPRPAFLVLTDAHYKEWGARVDGRRARILPVDLLFRGVCVPAGEHLVEFTYRPRAFQQGLALASLAGLGAVAWVAVDRRRRR
jgi:hypothetical protein